MIDLPALIDQEISNLFRNSFHKMLIQPAVSQIGSLTSGERTPCLPDEDRYGDDAHGSMEIYRGKLRFMAHSGEKFHFLLACVIIRGFPFVRTSS